MNCPKCGDRATKCKSGGKPGYYCLSCDWFAEVDDYFQPQEKVAVGVKTTPTSKKSLQVQKIAVVKESLTAQAEPSAATPRRRQQPEAKLVREITKTLELLGWKVGRIGQFDVRGSGSSIGIPDLLCAKKIGYGTHVKVRLLEVKAGKNKPSAAQQEWIDIGASVAVWSVEEALEACGEL